MSNRLRVLVADAISLDGLAPLRDDPRFELIVKPGLKGDELTEAIAGADAVLVRSATRITRESLARADRLKAIGRAGVGVDTIDVDAATERGIPVLTAPAGNTTSAAELTFALLLALARRIAAADRSMSAGVVDQFEMEMRIAACPCHFVPPAQHAPSACTRPITSCVSAAAASSSAPGALNCTSTWFSTTSLRMRT